MPFIIIITIFTFCPNRRFLTFFTLLLFDSSASSLFSSFAVLIFSFCGSGGGFMEDENECEGFGGHGGGSPLRVTCSSSGDRLRFDIVMRPYGETTIVSWKKLLKEAKKANLLPSTTPAPAAPPPAAAAAVVTVAESITEIVPDPSNESEPKDLPPSNHASAVVEKFERLYADEYIQSDNSTIKQNGVFSNNGKLDQMETQPTLSAICETKKRRKHTKSPGEKDDGHGPNKHAKLKHTRMAVSARSAPSAGNSSSDSQRFAANGKDYCDGKSLCLSYTPLGSSAKKSDDFLTKCEYASQLRDSNKDATAFPVKVANIENQRIKVTQPKDEENGLKNERDIFDATCEKKYLDKSASKKFECQAQRLTSDTYKGKNRRTELPDLNIPLKSDYSRVKDGYSVKPKGTMLERAIWELEKIVAESRPLNMEVQVADTSTTAIKRRLPSEVKDKLAKVASLAQSSQGRICDELINRLMSIVGHIVQLRTLKRNLREMVLLGLSAKREKEDRFLQIKSEVSEMIEVLVSPKFVGKYRDIATGEFAKDYTTIEEKVHADLYKMDYAIEDKLYDLHDLYVQGMDEDKGPQIKKLYVELAELWPNGVMDKDGIKNGIYRAEGRKIWEASEKARAEKIRRKKLAKQSKAEIVQEKTSSTNQTKVVQGGSYNDSTCHILALPTRMISYTDPVNESHTAASQSSNLSLGGNNFYMPKPKEAEKMESSLSELQRRQYVRNRVLEVAAKPERMASPESEQQRREYIKNRVKEFSEKRKGSLHNSRKRADPVHSCHHSSS